MNGIIRLFLGGFAASFFVGGTASLSAAELLAGPLVGHTTATSTRIWVETSAAAEILASTPCYAIWDDHDFGTGNSDRTFPHRETTLELFQRYWPNTQDGAAVAPGVFHSFRIADVEFFMLDNRYHRDPKSRTGRGTMFGAAQLD